MVRALLAHVAPSSLVEPSFQATYPDCYGRIDCAIQSLAAVNKISKEQQEAAYAAVRRNTTGLTQPELLNYLKMIEPDPVKSAKIVDKMYDITGNAKKRSELMLNLRLIKENHATLLGVRWTAGGGHALLIGRLASDQFVIYDAQQKEVYLTISEVMNYFKKDNKIKAVVLFGTPLSHSQINAREIDEFEDLFTDLTITQKRKHSGDAYTLKKKKRSGGTKKKKNRTQKRRITKRRAKNRRARKI